MKKRQKGRFRKTEKLQNGTVTKEKDRKETKKERGDGKEKRKKQWLHYKFFNGYFGNTFWPKKLLDAKDQFGNNVMKNPARYIYIYVYVYRKEMRKKN